MVKSGMRPPYSTPTKDGFTPSTKELENELWKWKGLTQIQLRNEQAPEIQSMYSLNKPISELRTKMRSEFERHRYVKQLSVVDMLIFQNHAEYQEIMNYWKQLPHVMKYFRTEEDRTAKLPENFIQGFLEGRN
ncbi:hypothetical protein MMC25_001169 [Agyrium rufum]|nr:hypothetical protein [Agyrium rufum]